MNEKDAMGKIIGEVGDISGWAALDMGSGPCTMIACLARKIGNGRVFAVDLYTGLMETLRKTLSEDLLLKTISIKADLRRLDFLKDDIVDLVTSYDTLSVIEEYTPGGTAYVLNEARRILKPNGWFIAVEHWPLESIKPSDKAQEAEVRWWKTHIKISKELGEAIGTEYTPDTLQRTLREAGFVKTKWKQLEIEATEPGLKFGSRIIDKAKKIRDNNVRKRIFREMRLIEKDADKYGMRELPRFVVYARNPQKKRLKLLDEIPLKELYKTVHRRDLLF